MMIEVLKSKLHCVRVTEANLNYMGSITIDEDLMDAVNMIAGEKVHIVDNNNGERFETRMLLRAAWFGMYFIEWGRCPENEWVTHCDYRHRTP